MHYIIRDTEFGTEYATKHQHDPRKAWTTDKALAGQFSAPYARKQARQLRLDACYGRNAFVSFYTEPVTV